MRTLRNLAVVLAVVVGLFALAQAGDDKDVTINGSIKCAKCMLSKADATGCQDVLVAADNTEYYLVKNKVAEKYGHACKSEKAAVVTGKVMEKDGKKWIEASKIEEPKQG